MRLRALCLIIWNPKSLKMVSVISARIMTHRTQKTTNNKALPFNHHDHKGLLMEIQSKILFTFGIYCSEGS